LHQNINYQWLEEQEIKNLMPDELWQAVVPRSKGLILWRLDNMGIGQKVACGEELGKIISIYNGDVMEKLYSPCSGRLQSVSTCFAVPYSPVCYVQPWIKK
jgi:hypothetical protein